MTKKIAVISDIHSNELALKAVLDELQYKGIKYEDIYCSGDLIGYGPNPNEVVEIIKDCNLKCVMGNNDKNIAFFDVRDSRKMMNENKITNSLLWTSETLSAENKAFVRELPHELNFEVSDKDILMVHGSPFSLSEYVYKDDIYVQEEILEKYVFDLILFGHTHKPYWKNMRERYFVNAGSVGFPKDGDYRACYSVIELGKSSSEIFIEENRVDYDVRKVVDQMKKNKMLREYAGKLI